MKSVKIKGLIIHLFVFIVTVALVGVELVVTAQNSNSSTTMQNDNMSASNMSGKKRSAPRRGRRRAAASMSNANSACGVMLENTNAAGSMNMTPARTGRCDPNVQTPEDLSGTYTGVIGYSDVGLSGPATLTINGNDFTLTTTTSGSTAEEGRIVAVNTCNYIGVTMMFGKWQPASPGGAQPQAIPVLSLTAKRTGGGLVLTTAPGETRQFSFTSNAGGGKKTGSRHARQIKPPTE